MKSLESIHLARNRLTEIPATLAKSTTICELFLSDNLISEIPMEILSMPNLTKLDVDSKCAINRIDYSLFIQYDAAIN